MRLARFARAAVLSCLVLAGAGLVSAAGVEFTETLTPEQQKGAGITALSPEQRATLNNLVQREVILATQGNVPAFAGEFSQRRSAPERAKAGIDKLSPEERASLNSLVATAIANRPAQPVTTETVASSAAVRGVAPKPIIHGAISFTAGTSGGGNNFYGGSVYVEQTDPTKGYSIGVGYSEFRGSGLPWPYWYGPYSYYDRSFPSPYFYGGRRW